MIEITLRIWSILNNENFFLRQWNGLHAQFIKKIIENKDPHATVKKIIVVNYDHDKFNEGTESYAFVTLQYFDKIGINSFANLGCFQSRLPYLSFVEGCTTENNHISRYLFNEWIVREICTYIDYTETEGDSVIIDYDDSKIKILWNIKKHLVTDDTLLINSISSYTTYYVPKDKDYYEYMQEIFSEESILNDVDVDDYIPPPIPMMYRDAYVEFVSL